MHIEPVINVAMCSVLKTSDNNLIEKDSIYKVERKLSL